MHKGRIEKHIHEILIMGNTFLLDAISINTMLMEKCLPSSNFIKHLTGLIIIGVFFIFYTKEKHLRGKL